MGSFGVGRFVFVILRLHGRVGEKRRASARPAETGGKGGNGAWGRKEFGGGRSSRTCLTMRLAASKRKLLFVFCSKWLGAGGFNDLFSMAYISSEKSLTVTI